MRYKILTVDDSKTVRIIVKKAFKTFDCDILEAANGVEGLASASKEAPDLILLDITMPVMDGVEMLTKLKSDPALKAIPVIMLTAEGGRDNVLKIAKIGVRDYIVKPFKEEMLIEKCGRILDLKPLNEGPQKAKSIFDPATILVVEDKPAIIQQIQEGLKHTPWKIHGVNTTGEYARFDHHQSFTARRSSVHPFPPDSSECENQVHADLCPRREDRDGSPATGATSRLLLYRHQAD